MQTQGIYFKRIVPRIGYLRLALVDIVLEEIHIQHKQKH